MAPLADVLHTGFALFALKRSLPLAFEERRSGLVQLSHSVRNPLQDPQRVHDDQFSHDSLSAALEIGNYCRFGIGTE